MAGIRKLLVKMPKMWIKMARSILIFVFIFFSCSKKIIVSVKERRVLKFIMERIMMPVIDYLIILLGVKNVQLIKFRD